MFDRRGDLVKFLAVAEAGGILAAAERLAITQPALSRLIARLEARLQGPLFERLPSGVRLTPLGTVAAERARHVLREIEAAEQTIGAAVSGRTGSFRITADPMWMEAVLAPAIARFRETCPGVELKLRTASLAEGLRRLAAGDSDLHCGGVDAGAPPPQFLRREHVLDITAGIVAGEGHPLLAAGPAAATSPATCASHLSHPGCIKNADRSAGTGDGTIFAVRRAIVIFGNDAHIDRQPAWGALP